MDRLISSITTLHCFSCWSRKWKGTKNWSVRGCRCGGAAGVDGNTIVRGRDGKEAPGDCADYSTVLYEVVENVNEGDGW